LGAQYCLTRNNKTKNFLQEKVVEATKQQQKKNILTRKNSGDHQRKHNNRMRTQSRPMAVTAFFLFLGQRCFPPSFLLLGGLHCFFL
jgi:uncharacterized membrane protein (DUF106 family)